MVWSLINKGCVAGSIPGSYKNKEKKEKKSVVANIEILQCVARRRPRRSLSLPEKEAKEPETYLLLVIGQTIGLLCHVAE